MEQAGSKRTAPTQDNHAAQHLAYMYMIAWHEGNILQQQPSHIWSRPTCWMLSGFTYIVIASGCYGNGRQSKRVQHKEKWWSSFEVGNASLVWYLGRGREEAREAASELLIDGSLLWRWSTHLARRYASANNEMGSSSSGSNSSTHTRACGCEVNYIYSEHLWHVVRLVSEGDRVVILAPFATSKLPHLKFLRWVTTTTHKEWRREGGGKAANREERKEIRQKSKKQVMKIS